LDVTTDFVPCLCFITNNYWCLICSLALRQTASN